MKIETKNFILLPRHLRCFNGCLVTLFDGRKGKITYPYILVSEGKLKHPMMIEKKGNFQEIQQVMKKSETGYVPIATRKNKYTELKVL